MNRFVPLAAVLCLIGGIVAVAVIFGLAPARSGCPKR